MNKNSSWIWIFALCSIFGSASSYAATATTPVMPDASMPMTATNQLDTTVAPKVVPEYETYSYFGDRYRDPFIPLIGDTHTDNGLERPPAITSLTLKGIVQDSNGRMALLSNGINSYILRGGRLYDGQNRMVKKISGVIKAESVVLIGADRTVRELRVKTNL